MKSKRGTWIAVAIVGILVAFTIFDGMRVEKADKAKRDASLLFTLDSNDVVKLEILDDKPPRILEKIEGVWRITSPVSDLVDLQEVNGTLEAMETQTGLEMVSENPSEASTYGLSKPGLTVKATLTGGAVQTLEIGSVSAFDGNLYARRGGDSKVWLIGSGFEGYFTKNVVEWRDKHLYRGKKDTLFTKIELRQRDPKSKSVSTIELTKVGEKWSMKGFDEKVEVPAIEAFVEQVRALRAVDFTELPKDAASRKAMNLENPVYSVKFSNEAGDTYSVEMGEPTTPDEKAPRPTASSDLPVLVHVFGAAATTVQRRPEDFLDRKAPFAYQVNDATRVEIRAPRAKTPYEAVFEKKGPDWVAVPSEGLKGGLQEGSKTTKLNDILTRMSVLEAVRFLGTAGETKMSFDSSIRLLKADGSVEFEMKWGKPVTLSRDSNDPEATFVPVATSSSKRIVGIPGSSLEDLGINEL